MSGQLLINAHMVLPGEQVLSGNLLLGDGKIAAFNPANVPAGTITVDCGGRLLTPGLIDAHTHGIQHYCYHCDQSPAEFAAALRVLPQYGTTCVVPTIVPPAKAGLLEPLARLFETLPPGAGAVVPGFTSKDLSWPWEARPALPCREMSPCSTTLLRPAGAMFRLCPSAPSRRALSR